MFITSQSSFDRYEFDALDQFYTPASLADRLVGHCDLVSVSSIADFAAGAGSLLTAALRRWPAAELYANDIDQSAVALGSPAIKYSSNQNFLADDYELQWPLLGFDLIILNPPFSQTPVTRANASVLGCSRALSFVRKALRYLNEGGQVIALLPSIVLTSLQDRAVLNSLYSEFAVEVIVPPTRKMFVRADVSVCALKISRHPASVNGTAVVPNLVLNELPWKIGRGRVSVARANRIETPENGWVHTTSLEGNVVSRRYILPPRSNVSEGCPKGSILLPRVGRPVPEKIVMLESDVEEVVSDCVIWIKSTDHPATRKLYEGMLEKFDTLRRLYCGTGAGFITYQRLNSFLSSIYDDRAR
jgi:predicted RNA methylase